jgi:acetylornithine deacetylase/succinyl-diaminopimelate desuccinylase-like protein
MSGIDYAKQHADRFVTDLVDLLKIPSISTRPEHHPDVERAALWLRDHMHRIGLEPTIFRAEGRLPLVYGEWFGAGPDAPTVLIYCHYDVQPAVLEDGWLSEPFAPTFRDGRIYARGAVDSKCHVIIQLAAVEALLAADAPAVNIKLLFEGEEESGSGHIFRFVREHAELLKCDVCVVSDGSMPDENQPILDYGLRGLSPSLELHVTGPKRDLHSGHFGGSTHNPIHALVHMLSQLHDEAGRVAVPGFYDDVTPLSAEERAVLAPIGPWIEAEWREVAGAPQPWGDPDYQLHERVMVRPTLEFNGIYGGYTGIGVKTVLPSTASAKITCRLVAHQDPTRVYELLKAHIARITPPTVTSELRVLEAGAPAVVIDRNTPAMRAVHAAYREGWGVEPIFSRMGGSVPVVAVFQETLNPQFVLMPFGYKGGGAHSTNEYAVIDMLHKGIATMLHFFRGLPTTA